MPDAAGPAHAVRVNPAEVTEETGIAAPVERVWRLVSDIAVMPHFSRELQRVAWADGCTGPVLGARFLGVNRHPAIGEWTTTSTVVEFEPPRVFAWSVGDPGDPAATWRFELQPTPAGSRLRYTARLGSGPSGVTVLIERDPDRAGEIVASRLAQFRSAVAATLAGIKGIAEADGEGPRR